jgi:hypothetical protein
MKPPKSATRKTEWLARAAAATALIWAVLGVLWAQVILLPHPLLPPPSFAELLGRVPATTRPDRFIVMLFKETSLLLTAYALLGMLMCTLAGRAGARKTLLLATLLCVTIAVASLVPVAQATGTGALRRSFPGNRAVCPIGRRGSQSERLGTARRGQGARPPLRTGRRRTGPAGGDSGARRRLAVGRAQRFPKLGRLAASPATSGTPRWPRWWPSTRRPTSSASRLWATWAARIISSEAHEAPYLGATATSRPSPTSTFLAYGGADWIVPPGQSQLLEAGVPHRLIELPWANHTFDFLWGGWGSRITRYSLEVFLESNLKTPAEEAKTPGSFEQPDFISKRLIEASGAVQPS